jgi:hypothetical protein
MRITRMPTNCVASMRSEVWPRSQGAVFAARYELASMFPIRVLVRPLELGPVAASISS